MKRFFPFSLTLLAFFLVLSPARGALTGKDCLTCHAPGSSKSSLHVPLEAWEASVHGKTVSCQECHSGVTDATHESVQGSGAVSCTGCHDTVNRHGGGKGQGNRVQCQACHTRHGILPPEAHASSVNPRNLRTTCGRCHPREAGDTGCLAWFLQLQVRSHGKQDPAWSTGRDHCLGCHQGKGAHGEEGPIHPDPCHRCHAPEQRPLMGAIHPTPEKTGGLLLSAFLYAAGLVFLLWGGLRFTVRRFSARKDGERR